MLKWDNNAEGMELAQIITDSVNPLFKVAEAGVSRCTQFTAGFGALELSNALETFVSSLLSRCEQMLSVIVSKSGIYNATATVVESGDTNNRFQDWDNFQVGLKVLGVCVIVSKKLESSEAALKSLVSTLRKDPQSLASDQCLASREILSQSTLNSLALNELAASPDASLFGSSKSNLEQFTKHTQKFLFDSLFLNIDLILGAIPNQEWNSGQRNSIVSPFNIQVPQFSDSPSTGITQLGEFLLTLPQQLDLYADESLWYNIQTLPYFSQEHDADFLGDPEYCTHLWWVTLSFLLRD